MPKIKTRKSITKRFKITKTGKVLRRRNFRRHLKASKSAKRIRNLKQQVPVREAYAKRIRKRMGVSLKKSK
jgi:large subunit ribosomal protein L35